MNKTLTTEGYYSNHMLETDCCPVLNVNSDACHDSASEMASQILASFRDTLLQKEREYFCQDLKPTYHNSGGDHQFQQLNKHSKDTFTDIGLPTDNTDHAVISPIVPKQEILPSTSQAEGNCLEIPTSSIGWPLNRSQDSNLQYYPDSIAIVSSSIDDKVYNGKRKFDEDNSSIPNDDRKLERSYQSKNYELPPCRVCGYKASGFHYGANTCEACKGFFRRSLKKATLEYKCLIGDNKCPIQKGRRNNCPLCRYNKCLDVGMSKDAIKTGRYTHEKRTRDIIEVKGLREGPTGEDNLPNVVKIKEENAIEEDQLYLIDKIYQSHRQLFPFWHATLESGLLPAKSKEYSENFVLKQMEGISKKHVEETNLNDSKDRNQTMDILTKHLELAIMKFVKFAKSIPGFCDLPLNDQATLVKTSRFEVWMIGAHKFVNVEYNVVIGPRGNAFHAQELSQVIDGDFVESMFNFSATLQQINLTNEEVAMLKCIVLTFSDRCDLEEPAKVDSIQLNLVSCLQTQLNSCRRFSQVMNALVALRDLTEWNKRISENLLMEWPTIKHNPLLMEVMAI